MLWQAFDLQALHHSKGIGHRYLGNDDGVGVNDTVDLPTELLQPSTIYIRASSACGSQNGWPKNDLPCVCYAELRKLQFPDHRSKAKVDSKSDSKTGSILFGVHRLFTK